jgi:hypothetical protein
MIEWSAVAPALPTLTGFVLSAAALLYAIISARGKASATELNTLKTELAACRSDCDKMQREVLRLVKVLVQGKVDGL